MFFFLFRSYCCHRQTLQLTKIDSTKKTFTIEFFMYKKSFRTLPISVYAFLYIYTQYILLHTQTYTYGRTHKHTYIHIYNPTRSYKCAIQLLSIYKKKLLTKHKSCNKLQNNYTIH